MSQISVTILGQTWFSRSLGALFLVDSWSTNSAIFKLYFPRILCLLFFRTATIDELLSDLRRVLSKGDYRPTENVSQKHQQLWEAQLMENVQLWRIIGQLQSEIADYEGRLIKLEAEVSSLKPSVDEPSVQVVRTGLSGAESKRGRPKRSVAFASASASPDESHPQARGQKPAANKVRSEPRVLVYEKVVLNKVEKIAQSTSSTGKDNSEKIPFVTTNNSIDLECNASNLPILASHIQAHQASPGIQIFGMTNSSLEMKEHGDKVDNSISIASQQAKQNNGVSARHMGGINGDQTLTVPASFRTEEPRRNIYNQIYMRMFI
ncbi:uncharacterized protein LOC120166949 [Hibiscus syriacus]|uniref:uncharacterized protein LOC120166949 n=1 Tax=Hibiscus syriacus TaxID=106335 RepID=UPI001924C0B3|nr:uncharacterized protein LOC120166949 [Hibiscus syriacus]